MPVTSYSTTPGSNNSAPPNGFPEGQAANTLNDSARQLMTDIAVEAQVNAVKVLASVAGTNTITGSMTPDLTAYSTGMIVLLVPANDNTAAATLNIDSLGAKSIKKGDGTALESGDLQASTVHLLVYDGTNFVVFNPLLLINKAGALNATADEVGYKGLPQNSQTVGYQLVLGDAGKHVVMNGTSITLTIPANASVAFPIGTCIGIFNSNTTDLSIAITTDSLILAGTTTTGTRTLARNGMASILKIASTTWAISGTGLS
jgi:hypothetical protein